MTRWGTVALALGLLVSGAFAGDEAVDEIQEARKKMELLLRKGEVLEKMGDVEGALKLYEEALALYEKVRGEEPRVDPRKRGANERTEAAVEAALEWLGRHQDDDGRWDCDAFMKHDPERDKTGGGGALYDVGVTGLSLLAFLSSGHTDRGTGEENPYARAVRTGLRFLMLQQDDKGCFGTRASQHFMYNHAIATAAMCQAYALTKNPRYKKSATLAAQYLLDARNPYLAWRYEPRGGENDTSVSGWCVDALTRAHDAALIGTEQYKKALEGALAWVEKITEPEFGQAGYNIRGGSVARPEGAQDRFPPEKSQAMTASALLMRMRAGQDPAKNAMIRKGAALVLRCAPRWKPEEGWTDFYFWYWGTRACYHVGGPVWKRWNEALQEAVLARQHKGGSKAGSWDPVGPWGRDGGRVYSTAILALTLQTYAERPIRK